MNLTIPFIVVQRLEFDFYTEPANIFVQAAAQADDQTVRQQHEAVAHWLRDIFTDQASRKAAGLGPQDSDFFACKAGEKLSLSFRFLRVSKKATHAIFVMQPVTKSMLLSHDLKDADFGAPFYPGKVSLGRNRKVWYESPDSSDRRVWELYTAYLTGLAKPDIHDAAAACK